MQELASILSQGFPHVRVDFYDVNGRIYFGELTFYHWSGLVPFSPLEWENKFGNYINLPIGGGYVIVYQIVTYIIWPLKIHLIINTFLWIDSSVEQPDISSCT